ncbi:hypothetical protein Fmac_029924 [Flemingia macrophylla]|uniref:Chalcone isomerase domain-containing protein n=1 Tax=Flemingia macrophylla TaxID=520843 RepID=A0ABD1LBP8_9FABA
MSSVVSAQQWESLLTSLNLEDNGVHVLERKTGVSFPSALGPSLKLLGIGLCKQDLGFKKVDAYAFGVYAADEDIKECLSEKYGKISASELPGNEEFTDDFMDSDIPMAVKIQYVYGGLSIGSVRDEFEESVGSRLHKLARGSDENNELLQRFISQFKSEFKILCGTGILFLREKEHVLRTFSNDEYGCAYSLFMICTGYFEKLALGSDIDAQDAGSIQSKLLCKSILDLYVGEEAIDEQAKDEIENNVATYL